MLHWPSERILPSCRRNFAGEGGKRRRKPPSVRQSGSQAVSLTPAARVEKRVFPQTKERPGGADDGGVGVHYIRGRARADGPACGRAQLA